jgi:hypothetical protein
MSLLSGNLSQIAERLYVEDENNMTAIQEGLVRVGLTEWKGRVI